MIEKFKIMVVEDSYLLRKAALDFFKDDENIEMLCVNDGYEAIAKILDYSPNMVLLDVNMPNLDGYKTCEILRSYEEYKDIPIIFISGNSGDFDKIKGKLLGGNEYITKPYKKEDLLEVVQKYRDI